MHCVAKHDIIIYGSAKQISLPLWRNWQTHLTQNQAGNTVPVRVRPAAVKKSLVLRTFFILCCIALQSDYLLFVSFVGLCPAWYVYLHRQSTTSIGATHRMGVGECHTTYWFLIYSCTICKLFSLTVVTK